MKDILQLCTPIFLHLCESMALLKPLFVIFSNRVKFSALAADKRPNFKSVLFFCKLCQRVANYFELMEIVEGL